MSESRKCSRCGADLPPDAPGGHCLPCLLLLGIPSTDVTASQNIAQEHQITARLESAEMEGPGAKIGRYKLLQQIGEGGMGVVYMAEQEEPVRRRVALKVIKLGMDTRQVVARFEAERQALALMDHPNIAKVLDGGATATGRPYFVMELVQGVPITEFCDKTKMPARERLKLFMQVCQAIQSAHQKGIIHRDIKPSNVLVTLHDGVPVPKVIDFGIAKATNQKLTEKTLFTNFATMIGTPAYMSPEQAEMSGLDIDTRTDIYALGVLLYALLTGTTPFPEKRLRSAGYAEMQRVIREEEPERPSTRLSTMSNEERTLFARNCGEDLTSLGRLLKGDLDWIVMKCLEKDRQRRYETANGLAADLKRHLENEPVVARPPSAAYKFQKAVRRNRLTYSAAAAVALALIAGAILTYMQAVRARHAETLAKARLGEVTAERDAKDQARKEAEEVATFLQQVFQSPDPSRDGRTITVAETLDRAVARLETDLKDQPDRRAHLEGTLALTYSALGLDRAAIPIQERVRNYWLAKLGLEHPETIEAMANLAGSYYRGRTDKGLKLREEVLALSRKVYGPEHPKTITAMYSVAVAYGPGRWGEALKLNEEVFILRRKLLGPEHPDTIKAMRGLANSYDGVGRRDDALKLREETLALSRKKYGPEHPDTITAMNNLAISYDEAGRKEEALKLKEESLVLSRKVNGPEHPATIRAMVNLANSYVQAGRKEEAVKMLEGVLAQSRKVDGPQNPETFKIMNNLGNYYSDVGRREDALKLLEEGLDLSRKVNGLEHPNTVIAIIALANSYNLAFRKEAAVKMGEEGLAMSRKVNGPGHQITLIAMNNLAYSYDQAGRKEEGLTLREQTLTLSRKSNGLDHMETNGVTTNPAGSSTDAGRHEDAFTSGVMNDLSGAYTDAGRHEDAIQLRREVLEMTRKTRGPEHPQTRLAIHNLGTAYILAGRREAGLEILKGLPDTAIKQWLILAPLSLGSTNEAKALDHEQITGEARMRPRAGERLVADGVERAWQAFTADDYVLDYNRFLGKPVEHVVAYAVCYVVSEQEQRGIVMTISSDDQVKVYLNGKEVYRYLYGRTLSDASDRVELLQLNAGLNVVVLKLLNGQTDWRSSVSLANADGVPLKGIQLTLNPDQKRDADRSPAR